MRILKKDEKLYLFIKDYLKLSDIEYLLFNNELKRDIKNKGLLLK